MRDTPTQARPLSTIAANASYQPTNAVMTVEIGGGILINITILILIHFAGISLFAFLLALSTSTIVNALGFFIAFKVVRWPNE